MAQRTVDHSRSSSTQPYRATRRAQSLARRLRDEPVTPHPPTTQIRVYEADGRSATIQPLADVLSPITKTMIATLAQRAPVAYFERIAPPAGERMRILCTLPDENERPIVLTLDETDAATIGHHARQFVAGLRHKAARRG
jgi:hypothetical protein